MAPGKRNVSKKRPSALLQGQQKLSFGVKARPSEAGGSGRTSDPSPSSPRIRPGRGSGEPGTPSPLTPPVRRGRSERAGRSTVRPSDPGGPVKPARTPSSSPPVAGPSAPALRRGAVATRSVVRPRRKCSTQRLQTPDLPPDYDTEPEPEFSTDEDDFPLWSPIRNAKGEYS